jgi:hypothetical protein
MIAAPQGVQNPAYKFGHFQFNDLIKAVLRHSAFKTAFYVLLEITVWRGRFFHLAHFVFGYA